MLDFRVDSGQRPAESQGYQFYIPIVLHWLTLTTNDNLKYSLIGY